MVDKQDAEPSAVIDKRAVLAREKSTSRGCTGHDVLELTPRSLFSSSLVATMSQEQLAEAKDVRTKASVAGDSQTVDPASSPKPKLGFWQWTGWNITPSDWDILLVSTVIKLLLYPS